jgi:enoyl-CoA hydratase/carnithine racemase
MFRLAQNEGVATLTLDRPEARNAIPLAGWRDLAGTIAEVRRSEARLLMVTGAGSAFCAGADLSDFPTLQRNEAARIQFREAMRAALDALRDLPIPVLAAVGGACYGAGVALAMACDVRVAGADARFAITPARYGISYPQEDVHRLVELVGTGQAARLLFTAEAIDAAEAARIGLVELHAPDGGIEAVIHVLLANDRDSLAVLKLGIRLAAQGRRSDPGQDRSFDALFAGIELAQRLEALRRK